MVLGAKVCANISIYDFRHLWISEALMADVDVMTAAKMAGTSVRMIETVYGHFRNDQLPKRIGEYRNKGKPASLKRSGQRNLLQIEMFIRLPLRLFPARMHNLSGVRWLAVVTLLHDAVEIQELELRLDRIPKDRHLFRLTHQPTTLVFSQTLFDALAGKGLKGLAARRITAR